MDLDALFKEKKKDFKCYNCGKLNYMARNCKLLKKKYSEILVLKITYVMEKEARFIYLLEWLGLLENNDDYEFYEFMSDLSDDSEILDYDAYSEIPDW